MPFSTYDLRNVSLLICAIPISEAPGEDEFIKIKPHEEAYAVVKGADGSVIRCATNNRLYEWSLTLSQNSPHNVQLSALHAVDKADTNGAGVGAFILENLGGGTLVTAVHCWITQLPEFTYGKMAKPVVWEGYFEASPAQVILGGT